MSRTQQFEGRLLEDALQSAVDTLGSDVQVLDARRVRSGGILGFFAREGFVVEAGVQEAGAPGDVVGPIAPAPAEPADFGAALARMVEQVEEDETVAHADLSAPGTTTGLLAPPPAAAPAHEVVAAGPAEQLAPPRPQASESEAPARPQPTGDPASRPEEANGLALGRPDWSLGALARLGVPDAILRHLSTDGYPSDLQWTAALEGAIEAEVPPPAAWSGAAIGVQGVGRQAAVELLAAGVAGFAPGTLVIDRQRVVACAAELALAVRACLPR